ncbi:hypothetical protein AAVH_05355 [Aphelenchoides avenae]|nr:hypothetical protein AAVH_05355 [Aphelenchus avenae]
MIDELEYCLPAGPSPRDLCNAAIRRTAVVDGCNIMVKCGDHDIAARKNAPRSEKAPGNALAVLALVHALVEAGFDVKLYVPVSFTRARMIGHRHVLKYLERLHVVEIMHDQSHDDLVQLKVASTVGGFVITNDRFADHHSMYPQLRELIEERVVRFNVNKLEVNTYTIGQKQGRYFTGFDITLLPKTERALVAVPGDPTFGAVLEHRRRRSQKSVDAIRRELDVMADFLQQEVCAAHKVPPPILTYFNPQAERLPNKYEDFRKKVFREQTTFTSLLD